MGGRPGVRLTLLTRAYCHLCDEMLAAVMPLAAAQGVPVAVVDVDADAALEAAYGDLVPVLIAGAPGAGTEICHHRFDSGCFEAAIAAARRPAE